MESSYGNSGSALKSDEPNDNTNLHHIRNIDVSMTPCGSCEGCNVTEDCGTRCENCVQNYIQTEIENNTNSNILPCLKRMCQEKKIPKKRQWKYPMLQVNNIGDRNVKIKIADGKEEIGASDEETTECKKGTNNNNRVLRSTSSESTATNNKSGLPRPIDLASGSINTSTIENASLNNLFTSENNGNKANSEKTSMTSNAMTVMDSTLYQLNSAAFPPRQQSHIKVKVRVGNPDSELQIIDMPKPKSGAAFNETSGKKSEPLKLVASNIYRTCACLEWCQADSCACVGVSRGVCQN